MSSLLAGMDTCILGLDMQSNSAVGISHGLIAATRENRIQALLDGGFK